MSDVNAAPPVREVKQLDSLTALFFKERQSFLGPIATAQAERLGLTSATTRYRADGNQWSLVATLRFEHGPHITSRFKLLEGSSRPADVLLMFLTRTIERAALAESQEAAETLLVGQPAV